MTLAALAAQLVNGLASASALFLLAAGLTLIFGVTRIVNFAHGSLYMVGAYGAWALVDRFGPASFWAAVAAATLLGAVLGALAERGVLRRLYDAPEMLQLTATFAFVLITRDALLWLFGAEDRLGPRVPGLAGTLTLGPLTLPQYDAVLVVAGPLVLVALTLLVRRTRFGLYVRAAAENRVVAGALGIDEARLFTLVFALGAGLAALAGALQLPREPANLAMDLPAVADAFVVTVVGGLGSIPGAFVAALLIAEVKALCIGLGTQTIGGVPIAFPQLTLVAEFAVMAVVLTLRPQGLFGRVATALPTTTLPEQRALVARGGRATLLAAAAIALVGIAGPLLADEYVRVLATDILVATLFAASLQWLLGTGGLTSFGHAAYFGVGAYAAALAARHGWPFAAALAWGPLAALVWAALCGWFAVRSHGVYLAMLTLAFAQITWAAAFQWDAVTGGSNGLFGLWPPAWLADRTRYFLFTAVVVGGAWSGLRAITRGRFGYAVRATRDSPLRAAASGIPVRHTQWRAFVIAGGFAGLAGALYTFAKGSIGPDALAIPRSVDAIVMVLLGGLASWFGPLAGAGVFTWLQDTLARTFDYWRAALGALILAIVLLFPGGIGGAWQWLRARSR
ncbi:MAG: ABC transporter permease [Proteobacteria bacterium]|nr:ABC transporter permease [Pseudomonadota bacterium]